MKQKKYLLIILLIINIFVVLIPYTLKNIELKQKITRMTNSNSIKVIEKSNEEIDYKLINKIKTISETSNLYDINFETMISNNMTININFYGNSDSISKLINKLYEENKNIIIEEAKINYDKSKESYIKLLKRDN